MISRYSRLLVVILIVAAALYVVVLNRESLTLHLSPSYTISTTSGVAMIGLFVIGILAASSVALLFGIQAQWRERSLHAKDRQRRQFYREMVNARGLTAAGDWQGARTAWESALRKDPTDVIARVELSRCYEGLGESREALRILDEARAVEPSNLEVLFRAAELHLASGNRTAAVDNLALVLRQQPSEKAARAARNLCEELDRLDEALEYHRRVEELGGDDPAVVMRLRFKQLCHAHAQDSQKLEAELRAFVKKHPEFLPAIEKLAAMLDAAGKPEDAADLLVKTGKSSSRAAPWHSAAMIWLRRDQPDRAVSVARAAVAATQGAERLTAELNVARVLIGVNKFEEAKKVLDAFERLTQELKLKPSRELTQQYLALKGLCLNRLGAFGDAARVWAELSGSDAMPEPAMVEHRVYEASHGVSPSLSTP